MLCPGAVPLFFSPHAHKIGCFLRRMSVVVVAVVVSLGTRLKSYSSSFIQTTTHFGSQPATFVRADRPDSSYTAFFWRTFSWLARTAAPRLQCSHLGLSPFFFFFFVYPVLSVPALLCIDLNVDLSDDVQPPLCLGRPPTDRSVGGGCIVPSYRSDFGQVGIWRWGRSGPSARRGK